MYTLFLIATALFITALILTSVLIFLLFYIKVKSLSSPFRLTLHPEMASTDDHTPDQSPHPSKEGQEPRSVETVTVKPDTDENISDAAPHDPLPPATILDKEEADDDPDIQEIVGRLKRSLKLGKDESADLSVISKEELNLAKKLKFILAPENETQYKFEYIVQLGRCLRLVQDLHDSLFYEEELVLPRSLSNLELSHGLRYLQELHRPNGPKVENSVSLAQRLLLYGGAQQIGGHDLDPNLNMAINVSRLKTSLIIGVDATPGYYGGYLVNLKEKRLEFYVIRSDEVEVHIPGVWRSPDQFEMVNFLLALAIWHEVIEEQKSVAIFTDNFTVLDPSKLTNPPIEVPQTAQEYGQVVRKLLDHFRKCRGVFIADKMYVNRTKDLVRFAKFIQPADDLSRLRVGQCVNFLCDMYAIPRENVKGTCHVEQVIDRIEPTPFHAQALKTATQFVEGFECAECLQPEKADELPPTSPEENGM